MWYGVVCKTVISFTTVVFSLGGGHDTVPCLDITTITREHRAKFHF